ncbi:2,3-bisphosphoglycerate-independent phosphoglycerate mutase [Methylophaga sp.]|jgi:2,3-bisphosphoglycerate-independent phosphoglycerate mutase|uniref:2,3-bisphosphoglycerate-independent phosphoglycerate mutase n=1 Tax=Methylophaga sp. TaxID=2024840 RepID=UPI001400B6C9|nr:2,3-bisphosphoglycerate-independent phosphoglycerate mutase [Methylophaga sp.]MTI63029.1 2,3-bisphosphoglycerate-independent phosphoglycerate mutase [Methylophaga sp.]
MTLKHRPLALIILDGWGYSEDPDNNAILAANTPVWDQLWQAYPHTLIDASGQGVGLPGDQMGNSEVGHLNLGAGRVVYQEFTRISKAIEDGAFFHNPVLTGAVDKAAEHDKAVHIFGLLSDGGVHSHEEHIHAMVKLAVDRGARHIYVHAFLDGRDTPPKSAQASIDKLEAVFAEQGRGRLVSMIGRYYAMDRDKRWNRVEAAYRLLAEGEGEFQAETATQALEMAYAREETDEFVKATTIGEPVRIEDGDSIVFMNFRADRAREITECFIKPDFDGFNRPRDIKLAEYVTLTEYKKDYSSPIAFPNEKMRNILGGYLSSLGLKQLRIAETEKYAHVTFFFNGGLETPFDGEDRILIPSPKVDTYDQQPEMSAPEVADKLVEAIHSKKYDVIICNFANADMVGHTGNFDAAVKAVEALDQCLGKVWDALKSVGGEMIVTADHGNAERMVNHETGQAHTAHTNNVVPLLFAGRDAVCREHGTLSDIAPTMLSLLDLPIPAEMSKHLLIEAKP